MKDLDGALNGGSNVVNERGSREELNENGDGEPHGLDAEFRNGLDDLLDGNGSCVKVWRKRTMHLIYILRGI